MNYATLSDSDLDKEKRRLSQKKADLSRDLGHINHELELIEREDHRRFCDQIRPIMEGKK